MVEAEDLQRPDTPPVNGEHSERRLIDQGLVATTSLADRHGVQHVLSLTREGKQLLEAFRDHSSSQPSQRYYAGVVKPRELAHDVQIYRLFEVEAARIEADGSRVTRVVLDYELKSDYQRFLNRQDRPEEADIEDERLAFAQAHHLPVIDGHLELPDLRIEYETADGRLERRDAELVTEHYSRAQAAGKARAGFSRYRSRGAGVRGSGQSRGGTPIDPHNLEWLR